MEQSRVLVVEQSFTYCILVPCEAASRIQLAGGRFLEPQKAYQVVMVNLGYCYQLYVHRRAYVSARSMLD